MTSGTATGEMPGAVATGRDFWVSLMYHDVQPTTAASGGGPERFAATLESFERALDAIRDQGYTGCSMAECIASPGTRRVAITFDDGWLGQYRYAAPALAARGMTATFFVTTDWIGNPDFMNRAQLRELVSLGMSVQSHTCSHPFLSELAERELRDELTRSRSTLEDSLGQGISQISLPGGDAPDPALRHVLQECGYERVAGSRWGINRDSAPGGAFVRRCTVRGNADASWIGRVIDGDRVLALKRYPREALLAAIRSSLGPTRYSRWRRTLLDAVTARG